MSDNIHLRQATGRSLLAPTLFGALKEPVRQQLLDQSPVREFSDGQLIQQQGQSADGFWVIEAGLVVVGQYLASGEFRAVAQLAEGDSYGELAVLADNRRVVDAIARGPARLRWIDAAAYRGAITANADSMRSMISALALECQELIGVIASGRSGGATVRVAALLNNLLGAGRAQGEVSINQDELGDLLGLTRATINKGLAELEGEGLISRGYGRINIVDSVKLRKRALI